MTWNYRVACKKLEVKIDLSNDVYEESCFGIVETYYNNKGDTTFTSENFIEPYGETLEDLKANFDDMKKAFELPVLDLDNIVYAEIDK